MKVQIVLVAAVLCFSMYAHAGADYAVDWRHSWDDPARVKYGYDYLADWFEANNGMTHAQALTFAKTGYFKLSNATPGFFWQGGNTNTFEIVSEMAGYADQNMLGWYPQGDRGDKTDIFTDGKDNGPHDIFITDNFGLYLHTPEGKYWYTQLTRQQRGPQALIYELEKDKKWLIAWEDLDARAYPAKSDNDYNDMLVTLTVKGTPSPPGLVPEPMSATLFLLGAGALGSRAWSKRRA